MHTVKLIRHPGKYWAEDEYIGVGESIILVVSLWSEDTCQSLLIVSHEYAGMDVLAKNGKLHGDQSDAPSSR